MALEKVAPDALLAALYDGGSYTPLCTQQGAVLAAFGMVGGQGAYAVCQKGEAMGADDVAVCRRVLTMAGETGNPVVTFYDAPGAKIDDGVQSMAAARSLADLAAKLSGVVPQIAVVTGVCGASSALAAACADLCVMAEGAELFLSPPFLSAAAGDKLPGAGGAKAAAEAGIAAVVAETPQEAARMAAKLVTLLPPNNLAEPSAFEYSLPVAAYPVNDYSGLGAIDAIADAGSAVELFDGFGGGVVTALGTIDGNVVGMAATNGPDSQLGYLCAARAARFARLCDAYSIPLVSVLNSGGFVMSSQSDVAGTMRAAARLAGVYADATCAKVLVLAGQTTAPLFTAMGSADVTIALQGSVTAPVAPSAAVSVLYKDELESGDVPIEAATAEYAARYATEVAGADAVQKAGLAELVAAPAQLRGTVSAALDMLASKRAQRLPKKHGNTAL